MFLKLICFRVKLGVRIGKSTIPGAGFGVFATQDFKKKDFITKYSGKIYNTASLEDIPESDYIIFNENRRKRINNQIDANTSNGQVGRYINDFNATTKRSNEQSRYNTRFTARSEREMQVVAARDIVAGEELFIDYGREYWKKKD